MTAAKPQRSGMYWLVMAALLLVTLPYAGGFLYAVLLFPAHSIICNGKFGQSDVIRDAINPVDVADYLYFLSGNGCHAPTPVQQMPQTPCNDLRCVFNSNLGQINSTYRGAHQYYNDDIFGWMLDAYGNAATQAGVAGSMLAVQLLNTNTIFQTLAMLFFLGLAIGFGAIITNLAQWLTDRITGKITKSP
jgi:hypothetical protein